MPRTFIKTFRESPKKKLFGRAVLAAAASEIIEQQARAAALHRAQELQGQLAKVEASFQRLVFKTKYVRMNMEAFAKLIRFIRVFTYRKIRVGFLSRGKKNRRKKFFAIMGGPEGTEHVPPRSPIPGFVASADFKEIKKDLAIDIKEAAIKYFNAVSKTGSGGSPVSIRQGIYKKYANHLAALLRSRRFYTSIQPPKKEPGTPLHDTGKLVGSIRGKVSK